MPLSREDQQFVEQQLCEQQVVLPLGRTIQGGLKATEQTVEYLRVPVHMQAYTSEQLVALTTIAQKCSDANISCTFHINSMPAVLVFRQ